MDYKDFFSKIKGKRIAVCGIGISNTPLIENFLSRGARVFACDRRTREAIGTIADELEETVETIISLIQEMNEMEEE